MTCCTPGLCSVEFCICNGVAACPSTISAITHVMSLFPCRSVARSRCVCPTITTRSVYARESFTDSSSNRQFVRNLIEKLLGRSDVVLLDTGFCIDDHDEIAWMEAATNGYGY